MKKILIVFILLLGYACSDGDLQIENIDFDGGTVEFCPLQFEQDDTERTLFFKVIEDEALILDLQSGLIANETAADTLISNLETQSTLVYRLFSENVSDDYFCNEIPPVTPTVLQETQATSGIINIVSSLDTVTRTTKTYAHEISIIDLTITNDNNERITDEPGLDFGIYRTTVDSSVDLVFSNYSDIAVSNCENGATTSKLFKIINDESIDFELPNSVLINEVTTDPRTIALNNIVNDTSATFSNKVFRRIITEDIICSETLDLSDLENEFRTVSGTLSVTTVEDADSTPETPLFNHTLTLSDFILEDSNGRAAPVIETYVFGTVTTTAPAPAN